MVNPVDIRVTDKVSGNIAKKLRDIGTEARTAHSSVELLKTGLREFRAVREITEASSSTRAFTRDLNQATRSTDTLNKALVKNQAETRKATTAQTALTRSTNASRASMVGLGGATTNLNGAINRMAFLLGSIVGARVLSRAADQATTLKDQLGFVTDETVTAGDAFHDLADIARATGLRFEDVGQQFTANARVLAEMGKSTRDQIKFQEGLSGALATSGLRGEAANVVMNALSRSMARGTLRGEEFNTVMERGQDVVRLIADEMGTTTAELRAMAHAGEITSERLYDAFTKPIDEIRDRVSGMSWTITGAVNAFNTELTRFVGTANDATGAARLIANAILFAADNVDILVISVIALASAWGLVKLGGIVAGIIQMAGALAMLAPILAAHPLMLLAGVVTAGAIAVAYMTGNLDGLLSALQSGVQSMMGFKQETENAGQSMDQLDQTTNNAAMQIMRYGENGIETFTMTREASDELAASVANIGEQAPAIDEVTNATADFQTEVEDTTEKVSWLEDALSAAWEMAKRLASVTLGDILSGGGRSRGGAGTSGEGSSSNSGSSNPYINGGGDDEPPGFATGGSAMVGGVAGVDKNLVQFRATRGERLDVLTPAQQRKQREQGGFYHAGNSVNITVVTPDADSFRRSKTQITREMNSALAV